MESMKLMLVNVICLERQIVFFSERSIKTKGTNRSVGIGGNFCGRGREKESIGLRGGVSAIWWECI